ncbi:MAG: hypothetical protein V9E88_15275 [Ferruginibacter sp.]
MRGAANTDFNARTSSTAWASTTAAVANTNTVRFSNTIVPASGLTFTWSPCTVAPGAAGAIAGTSPVCPGSTQTYSIATVAGASTYAWTYSGTGVTFTATTAYAFQQLCIFCWRHRWNHNGNAHQSLRYRNTCNQSNCCYGCNAGHHQLPVC